MYLLFTWRYDFDAGNIHYNGHRKGWALKIYTFLGPEMATGQRRGTHRERPSNFLIFIYRLRCPSTGLSSL